MATPDAGRAAAFQAFIDAANEDLSSQRGQIFERNSTRAPWLHFFDARVAQRIQTLSGQDVEITLDIQNVFDLLGSSLGQVETVGDRFALVEFEGYDDQGRQIILVPGAGRHRRGQRLRVALADAARPAGTTSSRPRPRGRFAAPLSLEGGAVFFVFVLEVGSSSRSDRLPSSRPLPDGEGRLEGPLPSTSWRFASAPPTGSPVPLGQGEGTVRPRGRGPSSRTPHRGRQGPPAGERARAEVDERP